mgnify:CR=1 FL=1
MEQRSLDLSLKCRYMFKSDIRNCYGAVNLQTIDWALSLKGTDCETTDNHDLANSIISLIQNMQGGKSFGMPQGSDVFDLIAEIILGYADKLLHSKIIADGIKCNYEILRYRDDYRIFCNDKDALHDISFLLQEVLRSLNFDMNSQKTTVTEDLIADSIKADKLSYIFNTPIFNKKGCDFDGIQKHLLYILLFARKYPNAGQVKILLSDLANRIEQKIQEATPKENKYETVAFDWDDEDAQIENLLVKLEQAEESIKLKETETKGMVFNQLKVYPCKTWEPICENIKAMSAIATQIAIENVLCGHYALGVISRLLSVVTDNEKKDIITLVRTKLCAQPNSDYMQLWMQAITYSMDKESKQCPYTLPLCKIVMGRKAVVWNNDWIKSEFREKFPVMRMCNKKTLKESGSVITFKERRAYYEG